MSHELPWFECPKHPKSLQNGARSTGIHHPSSASCLMTAGYIPTISQPISLPSGNLTLLMKMVIEMVDFPMFHMVIFQFAIFVITRGYHIIKSHTNLIKSHEKASFSYGYHIPSGWFFLFNIFQGSLAPQRQLECSDLDSGGGDHLPHSPGEDSRCTD